MFTLTFLHYTIAIAFLIKMITVQCLPIQKMERSASVITLPDSARCTDPPVIMSEELYMQLRNKTNNSLSLYSLWEKAKALATPTMLKAKVELS